VAVDNHSGDVRLIRGLTGFGCLLLRKGGRKSAKNTDEQDKDFCSHAASLTQADIAALLRHWLPRQKPTRFLLELAGHRGRPQVCRFNPQFGSAVQGSQFQRGIFREGEVK
jgi:hypothetical protein